MTHETAPRIAEVVFHGFLGTVTKRLRLVIPFEHLENELLHIGEERPLARYLLHAVAG